ncbi:MAG TPA: glycosyltransferase, partial [Ilumatobacteraceae bacterium]|nr:glycosyltransferase [Ilumatobacteraceae bacterium]
MKILMVSGQFPPAIGGIEVLVAQLAAELVRRGHDVAVLTGTLRGVSAGDGFHGDVRVHRNDLVRALIQRDPLAIARCSAALGGSRNTTRTRPSASMMHARPLPT